MFKGLKWKGVLAVEGRRTGDTRTVAAEAARWPVLPQPFEFVKQSGQGHDGSVVIGNITSIERVPHPDVEGEFLLLGEGDLVDSPEAAEWVVLAVGGFSRGVSLDLDDVTSELRVRIDAANQSTGDPLADMPIDADGNITVDTFDPEQVTQHVTDARIRGATAVSTPAYIEAVVDVFTADGDLVTPDMLDDFRGLVAAALPPAEHATAPHTTDVFDLEWDASGLELSDDAYAYVDNSGSEPVRFAPHHHEDGSANLHALRLALQTIDQWRYDLDIVEMAHMHNHIASHLRDAGDDPGPFALQWLADEMADNAETEAAPADGCGCNVIASAVPTAVPSNAFAMPAHDEAYPLTVEADGRIHGYVAPADSCHTNWSTECFRIPHIDSFDRFRSHRLATDDGDVWVGPITFKGGHADLEDTWRRAMDHYDNPEAIGAYVNAGQNEHGCWVAGVLADGLDDSQMAAMRTHPPSVDVRTVDGKVELIGLCLVNSPGFTPPKMLSRHGQPHVLIASGMPRRTTDTATGPVDTSALAAAVADELERRAAARERRDAALAAIDEVFDADTDAVLAEHTIAVALAD